MQKKYSHGMQIAALAGIYFLAAKFGLSLAFFIPQATTIWPPTGVAIAALLLFGMELWPGILIGAFAINGITHEPVVTALIIAAGNTFEALLCAWLLKKFEFNNGFDEIRDVVAFFLFSVLASAAGALIGTASLLLGGLTTMNEVLRVCAIWCVGDAMGALLFGPLLLTWFTASSRSQFLKHTGEAIVAMVTLSLTSILIFFYSTSGLSSKIIFLVFPFLIWGAFRLGRPTVATMNLALGSIVTFATLRGVGPFVGNAFIEVNLMYSHLFIYVASGMALLSAAAIAERDIGIEHVAFSEKRLRALVEYSTDGIVLVDRHSNVLYATIPAKSVLGYEEGEIMGHNIFSLVHLMEQELVRNKFTWLLAHPEKPITVQARVRHKQGYWTWIEGTATNLLDEPSVRAIVINYHDVTDRLRSEEKIESYTKELERAVTRTAEEMARGEALLSSIGDGFIATDKAGEVIFMNPAAEQMFGISMRDCIGYPLIDILDLSDEEGNILGKDERPIQVALATGKTVSTVVGAKVYYYGRPGGKKLPVAITAAPVILNGAIIGGEEVFKDITRDRQIDRAKSEFVSLTSHQLRTPLSIVNWYTEALLKGKLGGFNKRQSQYLKQIYAANQRLVNTVNNLLSVSRLEMGTFPIDPIPLDVSGVIASTVSSFSRQIRAKKLNIVRDFKKKFPATLLDRSLVIAVVDNLIANALKYTPDGGTIRIALSHNDRAITLVVEDNGYGIPKSEHVKVFDRFYRGSNVIEKNTDGNGLGLYIVKRIIESMRGTITFISNQDKGTTFSVTIPVSETHGIQHIPARRSTPARRAKVL